MGTVSIVEHSVIVVLDMLHFRWTWRYSRYLVGKFWSWLLWLIKRLARICSLAMWDWTDRWRKRPECAQKCLVWVVMFGVGCYVSDSNCNVWILTVPTVYFSCKPVTRWTAPLALCSIIQWRYAVCSVDYERKVTLSAIIAVPDSRVHVYASYFGSKLEDSPLSAVSAVLSNAFAPTV